MKFHFEHLYTHCPLNSITLAIEAVGDSSGKICTIRDKLDTAQITSPPVVEQHLSGQPFLSFQHVSEQTVRNVIVKSTRKTCELDPVPSV